MLLGVIFWQYVLCVSLSICKSAERKQNYRNINIKNVKSFQNHKAHRSALISVSLPSARHQFTLPGHGYGASASRGVPVYVPAFAGRPYSYTTYTTTKTDTHTYT